MKRLSILVLVILVLVAALAACAPTTPPEPPHEHSYATEWSSNETHHWYANTCNHGADVVSGKAEHVDAAEDGKCDVCDYVLFYTFTVDAPDYVTVSGDLKGKGDVTFTASVKSIYVLSVEGAEQVGEAAVEGGIATYTFKVANLASNDVEVAISAKQTVYANVVASATGEILPLEGQANVNGWKNYFGSVVLDIPAAGNYTLKSDNSGVSFSLVESTTSSDYSKDLTIEATEAGEVTVYVKYFSSATTVGSVEFEVAAIDVYETSVELDALSGSGYVIPAIRNTGNGGVTVTVTIPTPGIYEITAGGLPLGADLLAQYFVHTTQENEVVTFDVFVDEYHEGVTADLEWNVSALEYTALADGENEIEVPGKFHYLMSFTAPTAGDYVINCSVAKGKFYVWNTTGFTSKYVAGDIVTLAEGQTIEIAYFNSDYDPYVIYVEIAPYVAPADNELPMGDMPISSGFAAEYEFTATEAGKLVLVTGEFAGGSVDIKYLINGEFGEWVNGENTYEISVDAGDVVTVVIESEGQGTMNVSWVAGGSEGGEGSELGSESNPYIFDGEDLLLSIVGWADPVFVTIPAGVTVYIDGTAQFCSDVNGNDKIGYSVTPDVTTTYAIVADSWMAGAIFNLTTTAPEGGDEGGDDEGGDDAPAGQLPLGENINFEPDDVNVTYTYMADAYGKLTLTAGIPPMGTITITYSVNGGDTITLENNNVPVEIELYNYDVITVVVTNNGAYQSLTTAWETIALPDGSQENPYIFDGSEDLSYWANPGKPSYFVLVKGGTTAYILGKVTFNDGVENFTVVSPEVDTLYAVVTNVTDGTSFVITATKPAEGGDGSEYNPYIFDGTADIQYAVNWNEVYVIVKAGVTANLTGDATFYAEDYFTAMGTTVTPEVDTLYIVRSNSYEGAEGVITATAQGGEGTDPVVPTAKPLELGSFGINQKDGVYSYTAPSAGILTLTKGAEMGSVVVSYSVNGGEAVVLVNQTATPVELAEGDVVVITIVASGNYSSLTSEWAEGAAVVEPDGSQENPYIFDGTTVLSGDATFGMPSYFVMIKAGVTAYVHGNAKFGNDYGELFASVTPTEDTIYAVVADTFEGASFSISTEAPVVEEPTPDPAPTVETTFTWREGKSFQIEQKSGEYTYVAQTNGTFTLTQAAVNTNMGGSYARIYVRVNNGETVLLESNVTAAFELNAGDVVYITIEADAYSSVKPIWTPAA